MRFLKQLSRLPDNLSISLHVLGSIWMFILMFITTCDVFLRAVANYPIPGVVEFLKVSLVYICFLLLPESTIQKKHIRSDIFVRKMGSGFQYILAIFRFLFGFLLMIAILVGTWDKMIVAWQIWEYEGDGSVRIPMAPLRATIVISSSLVAYFFFRLMRSTMQGRIINNKNSQEN